jgi:mannose-6-phosphate isomerase-like protein (cupin superfamily)
MLLTPEFIPPALTNKDIYDRQRSLADKTGPTVFKMAAQLLEQGRTDTPLCATEGMTARLKVYASGGENALHAHPHEDHMFIVLQGSATFFDGDGEMANLGANEGIMLPKGSYYRFHATSDEPLVLLRVGTPNQSPNLNPKRINPKGEPMVGDSKENKTVPVRFKEGAYFG